MPAAEQHELVGRAAQICVRRHRRDLLRIGRAGRFAFGHATTTGDGIGTTKRAPHALAPDICSRISSAMFHGRIRM